MESRNLPPGHGREVALCSLQACLARGGRYTSPQDNYAAVCGGGHNYPGGPASGQVFDNPDLPPEHRSSTLLPQPQGGDMEMAVRQAYQQMQGGQYASRPFWLPSPQQDPRWCVNHTRTATGMNECVAMQDREYIPSQSEYNQAIQQDMQAMQNAARQDCINVRHGWWTGTSCSR